MSSNIANDGRAHTDHADWYHEGWVTAGNAFRMYMLNNAINIIRILN